MAAGRTLELHAQALCADGLGLAELEIGCARRFLRAVEAMTDSTAHGALLEKTAVHALVQLDRIGTRVYVVERGSGARVIFAFVSPGQV